STLFLHKFDCRDRPFSVMTCDRDSQSMEFIKRHGFHGPCFSVCENYGLSNELRFRSLERMQDRCCAELGTWHERFHCVRGGFEFSIPAASQEARFRAVAGIMELEKRDSIFPRPALAWTAAPARTCLQF